MTTTVNQTNNTKDILDRIAVLVNIYHPNVFIRTLRINNVIYIYVKDIDKTTLASIRVKVI